jgi:hypothetical protein
MLKRCFLAKDAHRRALSLPPAPAQPLTMPPPIYVWYAIFRFVEKVPFFPCIHKFLKMLKSGPRGRIFPRIFLWLLGTLKTT